MTLVLRVSVPFVLLVVVADITLYSTMFSLGLRVDWRPVGR